MNINKLSQILKEKLKKNLNLKLIEIEDKTYLHNNHSSHQKGKFHIKIILESSEIKKMSRIDANRKINSLINDEIEKYIHSIQILIL